MVTEERTGDASIAGTRTASAGNTPNSFYSNPQAGHNEERMPALINLFFEERVDRLFDLAHILEQAFSKARLEYCVVGGLAVYLYVEDSQPDAGRLTRDIDVAVRRADLERITAAVQPFGLRYRRTGGVDMLVDEQAPSARRAIHLVFAGEKVRPEYSQAVPDLGPVRKVKGIRLIPLPDLIRMKLTSFRAKDETHINDLDEAGLITPEIEAGLAPLLRERLARARARE